MDFRRTATELLQRIGIFSAFTAQSGLREDMMQLVRQAKQQYRQFKRDSFRRERARKARQAGIKDVFPSSRLFVTGVQRSGTNMVMRVLERHPGIEVYHETDRRAFDNFEMRSSERIDNLINQSPFPVVTIKALLEGHDIANLMETFAPAKSLWMYRHYDDVVNSSLRNWPGFRNKLDLLVADRSLADWRGRGMTDKTYEILRAHYTPDLDDASANALFWFYRNELFFDQRLDASPDVTLMSYEWLVTHVDEACAFLSQWLGLPVDREMGEMIKSSSIGKHDAPDIREDIRALCDGMMTRLELCWHNQGLESRLLTRVV